MSQTRNLTVNQGETFSTNVIAYTSNTSGQFAANLYQYANGAGQIRKTYTSAAQTANLTIAIHQAGTSNTAGVVTISMNSFTTNAISHGRYVYDVELRGGALVVGFSDGTKEDETLRVVQGTITVNPNVTIWDW